MFVQTPIAESPFVSSSPVSLQCLDPVRKARSVVLEATIGSPCNPIDSTPSFKFTLASIQRKERSLGSIRSVASSGEVLLRVRIRGCSLQRGSPQDMNF
ncbi:hypothetical protein R1flu_015022 [Riccia fluitans]|uniref:Uncharacterized protein n=1 Tax=Riccia fluitans TaxID=41844 RepID=A0ABD1YI58_9MARC